VPSDLSHRQGNKTTTMVIVKLSNVGGASAASMVIEADNVQDLLQGVQARTVSLRSPLKG